MAVGARAVRQRHTIIWPPAAISDRGLRNRLYQSGIFALKLAGSAVAGAAMTLGIFNNQESHRTQPKSLETAYNRPEPINKTNSAIIEKVEPIIEKLEPQQPLSSNVPRAVKTLRSFDGQREGDPAAVNSTHVPFAFRPNGTSLVQMQGRDGSLRLHIPLRGSLQNPAWSPDGKSIAFTHFRKGYNKGPADVYVINLETNTIQAIAVDGSNNISQPGSTWNHEGQIVFSSDRGGHDEVWSVNEDGSRPQKITSRSSRVAYEPSLSPDGHSVVFESNEVASGRKSRITLFEMIQGRYVDLTVPDEDCRQPNWSPRGDYIVYQRLTKGRWDLWLFDVKTKQHRLATDGIKGNKTDATFSPDGRFIVYSGESPEQSGATLMALPVEGGRPVPINRDRGYHGAPSWSPDGAYVAMETSARDPDESSGTELIITPVRRELVSAAR
jgi:TolB protein